MVPENRTHCPLHASRRFSRQHIPVGLIAGIHLRKAVGKSHLSTQLRGSMEICQTIFAALYRTDGRRWQSSGDDQNPHEFCSCSPSSSHHPASSALECGQTPVSQNPSSPGQAPILHLDSLRELASPIQHFCRRSGRQNSRRNWRETTGQAGARPSRQHKPRKLRLVRELFFLRLLSLR